ncbi:MAG TPA: hydroxymethylbilane synthase [Planctomycetota bacterium]|nr:hydroxymethylbilane synthase [Planctomycetota bacterium]
MKEGVGRPLRVGTRSSRLARWQAARVAEALRGRSGIACVEVLVATEGDRRLDRSLPEIGGKGVFTEALERSLRGRSIDLAVHSLKDLPIEELPDLVLVAVFDRADPRDVLIAPGGRTLAALPRGCRIGTSSVRRMAQLRAARPDVEVVPLRGNVDTRVRKALDGVVDAAVLAAAGVLRLGLGEAVSEVLSPEVMLPAPGQGALAVQCRRDDLPAREALALLDDPLARAATTAERAFLAALGGGCLAPVAALARPTDGVGSDLDLVGLVLSPDGARKVRVEGRAPVGEAKSLAARLAAEALARGAKDLLE